MRLFYSRVWPPPAASTSFAQPFIMKFALQSETNCFLNDRKISGWTKSWSTSRSWRSNRLSRWRFTSAIWRRQLRSNSTSKIIIINQSVFDVGKSLLIRNSFQNIGGEVEHYQERRANSENDRKYRARKSIDSFCRFHIVSLGWIWISLRFRGLLQYEEDMCGMQARILGISVKESISQHSPSKTRFQGLCPLNNE